MKITVGKIYKGQIGFVKVVFVGGVSIYQEEGVLYKMLWESPQGLMPVDLPSCLCTVTKFKQDFEECEEK